MEIYVNGVQLMILLADCYLVGSLRQERNNFNKTNQAYKREAVVAGEEKHI
jgi:hypothetical protein